MHVTPAAGTHVADAVELLGDGELDFVEVAIAAGATERVAEAEAIAAADAGIDEAAAADAAGVAERVVEAEETAVANAGREEAADADAAGVGRTQTRAARAARHWVLLGKARQALQGEHTSAAPLLFEGKKPSLHLHAPLTTSAFAAEQRQMVSAVIEHLFASTCVSGSHAVHGVQVSSPAREKVAPSSQTAQEYSPGSVEDCCWPATHWQTVSSATPEHGASCVCVLPKSQVAQGWHSGSPAFENEPAGQASQARAPATSALSLSCL
jgi:hypothetical protein